MGMQHEDPTDICQDLCHPETGVVFDLDRMVYSFMVRGIENAIISAHVKDELGEWGWRCAVQAQWDQIYERRWKYGH